MDGLERGNGRGLGVFSMKIEDSVICQNRKCYKSVKLPQRKFCSANCREWEYYYRRNRKSFFDLFEQNITEGSQNNL